MAELSQTKVDDWVISTEGQAFHVSHVMRELELDKSQEGKLRVYLHRLVKRGVLAHTRDTLGHYRLVGDETEDIDIFGKAEFFDDFLWPFPLEKYVRVGRKGIVVIAAEQGLCKTAFCLNVAMLNGANYPIWYYDSESGPDLLQERLFALDPGLTPPLPFHLKEMPAYPEDAVRQHSDDIVILDYIEEPEEAWRVAGIIHRISKVVHYGMVVIALQKPPGRDAAFGGQQVLNKPQLYLAAGRKDKENHLKIVRCKSRVNNSIDPTNFTWTFSLKNYGTHFTNIARVGENNSRPDGGWDGLF